MTQRFHFIVACEDDQEDILSSIESALPRLNEFIHHRIPTLNAPGLALGLTHRDNILYVGTYGLANQETGQPVTPETLFQIGSISKSFTSIALLQLQEQGLIDIDDPVAKHLPWFEIQSEHEPIRLRHLMSHTAGIITGSDETVSAFTEAWNLRFTKAAAPPGQTFHYSNSGYKVLGLVLEVMLKQSIGAILRERIIEPLGMDSTLPVISSAARSKLAVGYGPFFDDRPLPPGGLLAPATWLESDTADGSICSTAADMCKYIQVLLKGGQGLLSLENFSQMIKPAIQAGDGNHEEAYGLGLFVFPLDGQPVIGHSGGMVGYTADMLADIENGLGVIVLTNGPAEPEKISRYALRLLRATWEEKELPEIPPMLPAGIENPDDYAGRYYNHNQSFTLTTLDERLLLDCEAATVTLEPYGPDRFLVPHPDFQLFPLQFRRDGGQITEAAYGGERYLRDGVQGLSSIAYPVEWVVYPGHYRSHNPWLTNFRVVLRGDTLILLFPSGDEKTLNQLEPGLFRVGEDPRSPEFIRFDVVIAGKAMQAILSGGVYSRTFTY
jgi:D-alanyl-D-alanine carboxypeptidase